MDNYLNLLAKQVLGNTPDGLTKVKFAKILYFVYKGLVQKSFVTSQDLKFIRMPLGPVPVGFKDLSNDEEIKVSETHQLLSYDMQLYKLIGKSTYFEGEISNTIQEIVTGLVRLPTSVLVDEAHKDPSWINHKNGDEYYLTEEDLAIPLPLTQHAHVDQKEESQHLQAKLVEGMLDEIVDESTFLEYPNSKLKE